MVARIDERRQVAELPTVAAEGRRSGLVRRGKPQGTKRRRERGALDALHGIAGRALTGSSFEVRRSGSRKSLARSPGRRQKRSRLLRLTGGLRVRRRFEVVTERQTSVLSQVVWSNRPRAGQGKPTEAGRARCRRSVHRRARFCRSSAGNQLNVGCASLKTWCADVGRTHLRLPGPAARRCAREQARPAQTVGALDGASRLVQRTKGCANASCFSRTAEARGVGCGTTRGSRYDVRRFESCAVWPLIRVGMRGDSGSLGSSAAMQAAGNGDQASLT